MLFFFPVCVLLELYSEYKKFFITCYIIQPNVIVIRTVENLLYSSKVSIPEVLPVKSARREMVPLLLYIRTGNFIEKDILWYTTENVLAI